MAMKDNKLTHTLHVVIQSADKYRTAILISKLKCEGDDFEPLEGFDDQYEGIEVVRHKPSSLVVLVCEAGVKTWIGSAVSEAVYDLVKALFGKVCVF